MSVNAPTSRDLSRSQASTVRAPIIGLVVLILAILALYFETIVSIIGIWVESDTYFHGFLIFPISAYLVWRSRSALHGVTLTAYSPGVLVLVILSITWWICVALGIQVGAHASVIALIPAAVLTGLGTGLARAITFPLAYLVFAVPFGDFLVPPLMEFTATFTVWALNLTGIPVIREGMYFSIPAGNFEVAATCSGIRYLLATLALSALYAHVTFVSTRKRLLFLGLAILVPVIANAFRAYGIVMIAHLSEMRFAVGADHILYGWVFFGFVMAFLFWIGNRYNDDHVKVDQSGGGGVGAVKQLSAPNALRLIPIIVLAIIGLALGPTLQWRATGVIAHERYPVPSIPAVAEGWKLTSNSFPDWQPVFMGSTTDLLGRYTDGERHVDLAVVQYQDQLQGEEIVNARNSIADEPYWDILRDVRMSSPEGTGAPRELRFAHLRSPVSDRLVWYWFEVNSQPTASSLGVKILEGKSILFGRNPVSTLIAVSVRIDDSEDESRRVLGEFLDVALPSIERCIREPASTPPCARAGQRQEDF